MNLVSEEKSSGIKEDLPHLETGKIFHVNISLVKKHSFLYIRKYGTHHLHYRV